MFIFQIFFKFSFFLQRASLQSTMHGVKLLCGNDCLKIKNLKEFAAKDHQCITETLRLSNSNVDRFTSILIFLVAIHCYCTLIRSFAMHSTNAVCLCVWSTKRRTSHANFSKVPSTQNYPLLVLLFVIAFKLTILFL